MRLKPEDLSGAALDWAVAEVLKPTVSNPERFSIETFGPILGRGYRHPAWDMIKFAPSTDWKAGGWLIETCEIGTKRNAPCSPGREWEASPSITAKGAGRRICYGPTLLIAAMRCITAALGTEIDVPDELLNHD